MKIIGYGICGPGEAHRYMEATMKEFARLCDETIILCNNTSNDEQNLIKKYGFKIVIDNREWGRLQWKIKEDFLNSQIAPKAHKGDMMVCLDMDEVFCEHLTRDWLMKAPLDAYHCFIVDLWNDGYKPESCFWNVRLWRWNGDTKFKAKPVHCGLAPEWTYHYHRFAPFLVKHSGLKLRNDRIKKLERYQKYDPKAEHLGAHYYAMLKSDYSQKFDEAKLCDTIEDEVETYQQKRPSMNQQEKKKVRFAYVKNPHGVVIDIPERNLAETLKRGGFEFIGWEDDKKKEMEKLFEGVDVGEDKDIEKPEGSYHGTGPQHDSPALPVDAQKPENTPKKASKPKGEGTTRKKPKSTK